MCFYWNYDTTDYGCFYLALRILIMRKYYPSGYRPLANYLDDEEQAFPLWVWLLAVVVISLVLIVR